MNTGGSGPQGNTDRKIKKILRDAFETLDNRVCGHDMALPAIISSSRTVFETAEPASKLPLLLPSTPPPPFAEDPKDADDLRSAARPPSQDSTASAWFPCLSVYRASFSFLRSVQYIDDNTAPSPKKGSTDLRQEMRGPPRPRSRRTCTL